MRSISMRSREVVLRGRLVNLIEYLDSNMKNVTMVKSNHIIKEVNAISFIEFCKVSIFVEGNCSSLPQVTSFYVNTSDHAVLEKQFCKAQFSGVKWNFSHCNGKF